MILSSLRHLPFEVERLKQGHWHSTVGTRLEGNTLGIYAFGHIGGAVARVGRAFGMKVVCWGREGSTARARAEGFEVAASREAFFEAARASRRWTSMKRSPSSAPRTRCSR